MIKNLINKYPNTANIKVLNFQSNIGLILFVSGIFNIATWDKK